MSEQSNIESWCQKVLDLLDLSFADHLDLNYQIYLGLSKYLDGNSDKCHFFLSNKEGKLVDKLVDFYGIFQIFPDISRNLSHANSETKKV